MMRPAIEIYRTSLNAGIPFGPIASSSTSSRTRLRPLCVCNGVNFGVVGSTSGSRTIHTSRPRLARVKGHYEALSLPRNATKQQVKARFYELSKKHHPDTGGDTDKFLEINEAYHTLGDEGRRRQYDNSMTQSSRGPSSSYGSGSSFYPHSPGSRPSAQGPHRAWTKRPPPRSPNEPFNPFARPHAYPRADSPFGTGPGPGPGTSGGMPFGRTSTGRRTPGRGRDHEFEGLRAEGGLWRFGMVVGLLVAVVSFGGGLSVSAEELHPSETLKGDSGSRQWKPREDEIEA